MTLISNEFIVSAVVIGLLFSSNCSSIDYCGANICNGNQQHTLCKFQSEEPARHCIDFEKTLKTDQNKMALLDKLNDRRNRIAAGDIRSLPSAANMLKLEWNLELEMSSQRWANQCVQHSVPDLQDSCRDLEDAFVGQNIATVLGDAPGLSTLSLVDVWYMELLNINASVLEKYTPSFNEGYSHYDYFTQLIWADSNQVGCGAVKFKERYKDEHGMRNRTIYRLVCNFAPTGNRNNKSVYINGLPCSQCPLGATCDVLHKALCKSEALINSNNDEMKVSIDAVKELKTELFLHNSSEHSTIEKNEYTNVSSTTTTDPIDEYTYTIFDFLSHFDDYTTRRISDDNTKTISCKEPLGVDDIVELLKKRLSDDPTLRALFTTKSALNYNNGEISFTDLGIRSFINKIYSKKETPTTTNIIDTDYVNSTLLVDLIESVIFKSGGYVISEFPQETSHNILPEVTPVRIQPELAQIKPNYEFTGHYFFPEDNEDSTMETAESYYDVSSNLPIADIVWEIENIKKSSVTKDFLEEIIDDGSVTDTSSPQNMLSPDDITIYKSGHRVMKKFLKDIEENYHKSLP